MEAEGRSLNFLVQEDSTLEIPFFQRPYVWSKENWNDLLDDLLRTNGNHFLGSLIIKRIAKSGQTPAHGKVIDGQQRLTTLSILIKVMYELLQAADKLEEDIIDNVKNSLFSYSKSDKKYTPLICHSHLDKEKYEEVLGIVVTDNKKIFKEITSPLRNSILKELEDFDNKNKELKKAGKKEKELSLDSKNLLRSCYKFFYYKLRSVNIKKIKNLISSLYEKDNNILVLIDIDNKEQEQEIFDTINSAGLALSSTDIIKNALFEKLRTLKMSEKEMLSYYEESWQKTFEDTDKIREWWGTKRSIGRYKRDNTEILLHSVGIIKGIFDVENQTIADLAKAYKNYIDKIKTIEDIKDFIETIISFANIYQNVIPQFDPHEALRFDDISKRLSCIMAVSENTTFTPYVLFIYYRYKDDNNKLCEKLAMIEKIIMHYLISGQSNKNFNKYCYQLVLKERDESEEELLDYVAREVDKFSNSELKEGLKNVSNKLGKLFLYWVELSRQNSNNTKDISNAFALEYDKKIELEHILPQQWDKNPDWIKQTIVDEDGTPVPIEDNPTDYRNNAIYSIGNMTLLYKGLNSSVSNWIFKQKYNGDDKNEGMKSFSKLAISSDITKYCKNDLVWSEESIIKREIDLANEIIEIWGCQK